MNTKKEISSTISNAISLVQALMARNLISEEQANALIAKMKIDGLQKSIEEWIIEKELVAEKDLLETKASLLNVPYVTLNDYIVDIEVLNLIPGEIVQEFHFFPIFQVNGKLFIAMNNPNDVDTIDKVSKLLKMPISPALSSKQAIEENISRYYGGNGKNGKGPANSTSMNNLKDILEIIEGESSKKKSVPTIRQLERMTEQAPVVRMTSMILNQAILDRASDVHLIPEENRLRVQFRIDGVLGNSLDLPKHLQEAIVSRIKILSNLDIAEQRIPQDGQLALRLKDGRRVDIRVSTMPIHHGEDVVLRILDKDINLLNLENLGFEENVSKNLIKLFNSAYGTILVTGPTGSGKTTTLYAALNRLSMDEKNIMTLEDPIEYSFSKIRQAQVNYKSGMTFAKGLRAILRHDPDIIMIGEIRDPETALISIQAALTGHLVLSTLHTNDAVGAIVRLTDFGIEPFLLSSSILGVLAQRLVRKICPHCKQEYNPSIQIPDHILKEIELANTLNSIKYFHGKGCSLCKDTGYQGRMPILELFVLNDPIRELIIKGSSSKNIKQKAIENGMYPMIYDGWIKVLKGITTVEEVLRVTNIT